MRVFLRICLSFLPLVVISSAFAQEPAAVTPPAEAFEPEPLRLRLYGDVQARTQDGESPPTFSTGGVDFFATSRPAPNVNLLAEVLFEPGEDNTFAVDVERLMAEYAADERFTLGFGRYHTSIGYYNTAFHHGNYFQAPVGRPAIFSFEDDSGPLPVHGVGAWVRGAFNPTGLGIRYVLEISNGRPGRTDVEAVQNVQDEDRRKAWNGALVFLPGGIPGFETGISYYRDQVSTQQGRLGESILAVHAVYRTLDTEILAEGMRLRHERAPLGTRFDSWAYYGQVSRAFGRFRPFFRYEKIDFDARDFVYALLDNVDGPSMGLRFDPARSICFKLQVDRRSEPGSSHRTVATFQTAFAF